MPLVFQLKQKFEQLYREGHKATYNLGTLVDFISQFENRKLMDYFEAVEKLQNNFADKAELDKAYELLRDSEHLISIKENDDWRMALKKAAKIYGQQMVAAVLPAVYDEYVFRIENNIPFEQNEHTLQQMEHALQMCALAKDQITGGRILNGESGDLNF